MHTDVHNSKVKTTLLPINWWTDKQNVVQLYSAMFFTHREKWNTDKYYHMDEFWKHAETSQTQRPRIWLNLYKMCGISKSMKTESRLIWGCQRLRGGVNGEWIARKYGMLGRKVIKMFWNYVAANTFKKTAYAKNHWITNFKVMNFIVCGFYLNKVINSNFKLRKWRITWNWRNRREYLEKELRRGQQAEGIKLRDKLNTEELKV